MQYTRGRRVCLNMLQKPVDGYIEHKNEIEEILKQYTIVPHKSQINENQQTYISSARKDKNYVRTVEICKGSKIYSTGEDDLYELDKELIGLGYKTRMGRNCNTGTLSIAVLDECESENK